MNKGKKDLTTVQWLYHNSKKQVVPMILLITSNAFLATFGVIFALVTKDVINNAVKGNKADIIKGLLILFGIIITQLLISSVFGNVEARIQAKLEIIFRTKIIGAIMLKDYTAVAVFHSGELQNRLTSDISIVSEGVTSLLPSLVAMLTRLIFALIILISMNPNFAIIFVIGGIILLFLNQLFRPMMKKMHKRVLEADGHVRSFFQEIIESLLMVKVFGIKTQVDKKSEQLQKTLYKEKMHRQTISIFANTGFSFIFQMGFLYAIAWGAYHLYLQSMTFGDFAAIQQLVGQVQAPFAGLSGILPRFYSIIASAERLIELENLPDEKSLNPGDCNIHDLYKELDHIVFEDICFKYNRDIIFDNANLKINKGDFVVISGISGIGKSTLFKLLLGVISPVSGKIYFETTDHKTFFADKNSRCLFAYVPQGNLLLSGTIRETVSYINHTVTDDEIMTAAKIACADGFINEFPDGLDTQLGEKGKGLSEGQMQRLSITRALLSNSPILLFDEATSALDEQTEERLLLNIKSIENRTCIVISHKKAAFRICNKEIIIDNKTIYAKDCL